MHRCVAKGTPLPPPTPCGGARVNLGIPKQRAARGGYTAEPARDNPPTGNLPPPIGSSGGAPATPPLRDAPGNDPNKPATSPDQSPTTLGAAAPGQDQAPNVKIDGVAPNTVPVPKLGSNSWSRTFTDMRSPAAVQITQRGIDSLHNARVRTGEWIVDQGKEKGTDKAIEKIIERLPFSEAIKGGIGDLSGQVQRFNELFKDKKKSAEEYFTKWYRVTRDTIKCTASLRIDCDKENAEKVESVKNEYGDREGKRWDPWVKQDVGGRVSVEDPRKP